MIISDFGVCVCVCCSLTPLLQLNPPPFPCSIENGSRAAILYVHIVVDGIYIYIAYRVLSCSERWLQLEKLSYKNIHPWRNPLHPRHPSHPVCVCVCWKTPSLFVSSSGGGGGIFLRKSGVKMPEIRINVTTKEENRDNGRGHHKRKKKGRNKGKKKGPLWILKRGRKSRDGWGGGGESINICKCPPPTTNFHRWRKRTMEPLFSFPLVFFFPFYSAAATPQNPTSKGPCTISSGIHIHIRLMMASFFFSPPESGEFRPGFNLDTHTHTDQEIHELWMYG